MCYNDDTYYRCKGEGEMDYYVNNQEKDYVIEIEKNRVKGQIIDQYISIRKEKGFSQEKIAELSGIARTNIVRIEAKKNVPTIEVLIKLAAAIDMDLEIKFVEKAGARDGK